MRDFVIRRWILFLAAIIIGVHLILLLGITFFPYPELFIYSYLTKAGLIPYKQIFDQHFPGLMFLPLNLSTLGMDTPSDARYWHLGSVLLSQILIFLIGFKLTKRDGYVILGNFLYLLWQPFFEGNVLWIETFITPILLASFYFFMAKHKNSFFWSGLFLGLALVFKQVLGPLVVVLTMYIFFISKERKGFYKLVIGLAIPMVLLSTWISFLGIWREFWYWVVTYNLTTFAEMGRKYPDLASLIKALPLFGAAVIASLFSIVRVKKQRRRNKTLELLILYFVGTLVFAYARWDYIHLQPALPFAILMICFTLQRLEFRSLIWASAIYLLVTAVLVIPFYKANLGGRVMFFGEEEVRISSEVMKYAKKGESVFALGTFPHLYQVTGTLPPGMIFVFQFPWFMVEVEEDIYKGIITDPPKVVVRDKNAEVAGMNLVSFMPKIDEYFDRYYRVVNRVGGAEIMIPN